MRLLFLIRSLGYGGAERQLVALARGLAERGHDVTVMTFYPGGPIESELAGAHVKLVGLGKRGRWDVPVFFWRMARATRAERPDVVHGYLAASNLCSLLLRPIHGAMSVWGVRASDVDFSRADWLTRLDNWTSYRLARFADLVIVNSHAGKRHVVAGGFPERTTVVIPNGIDTDRFRRDEPGREAVRAELGVGPDQPLIGRVGRIDPQKDYPTFVRAAALIAAERPEARFVCVGGGRAEIRAACDALASGLGVSDRIAWLGTRPGMPALYSALDLLVSSSAYGEGTPNVVAEAMACGVPCVVTDVGDSALTVGPLGQVTPKSDPHALANAALETLAGIDAGCIDRDALRARIVASFSLTVLVERTEREVARLLAVKAPSGESVLEAGA